MGHHNLRAEPLIIGAKSAVEGVDAMKPAQRKAPRTQADARQRGHTGEEGWR
jgi:hypothetical protein